MLATLVFRPRISNIMFVLHSSREIYQSWIIPKSHHHQFSSPRLGYKAAVVQSFHWSLCLATFSASPHVIPISLSSASILLLQVDCGLPLPLLPGGVHLSATLVILLESILMTCPTHLSLLSLISSIIFLELVLMNRSSFKILLGQQI